MSSNANTTTIQELLDKQEISEVVLRFCRGVDRLDRELIRSAYHDDAFDEHGPELSGNVDDFVDGLMAVCRDHYISMCHYVCNQLIELDGDTAYCETYYIGVAKYRIDERVVTANSYARYIDRFERRETGWRIAHRIAVVDAYDEGPRPLPGLHPSLAIQGTRGRTDPVFTRPR